MDHPLLKQYPNRLVELTEFSKAHPDLLPIRRARTEIARLYTRPPEVQRIFKKRFGRWHVDVVALVEYIEKEDPIL